MRILSIDPGLSGAWAVLVNGRPTLVGDMPIAGEGASRRVAAGVLAHVARGELPDLCVIEQVGAMPKQGVSSTFRFGMAYGAAMAVANVLDIPVELVRPAAWKKQFNLLGKDKEASRQRALDLAPQLAPSLARKRDDGRAEAILIGLYAHATWGQA